MRYPRITWLFFMLFVPATGWSQTDDQLEELAASTCQCITAKNIDKNDRNALQAQLGICMLEAAGKLNIKFDGWSQDEFRQMGEKVGLRMAMKCPSIFESFANQAIQESEGETELKGRIKAVELNDPTTLVLREESGKEHRLLWINYFAGSDDFAGDPKKLVNRTVTVQYQVSEIYFSKSKGYLASKVLTKLTVD